MNPKCERCNVNDAFNEPWMPPAQCCECGKTLCKACMDEDMFDETGSYVCLDCHETVHG